MTYPLDSLLNDWKAKNYIDLGKDCSTSTENPFFSDSVYIDRLSRIPAVMEMPYNEIVRKFIDMYTGRLRNNVSFMLSACNFYMPIFEEALDTYGLKALTFVLFAYITLDYIGLFIYSIIITDFISSVFLLMCTRILTVNFYYHLLQLLKKP